MEMTKNVNLSSWEKVSFRFTYLIALAFITIFAIYTYIVYGIGWIDIFPQGTWLVLGGFSLFYPTSGFQILCAVIIGIQMFFSAKKITITPNNDIINIQEQYKIGFHSEISIKRKELARVSIEAGGPSKRIFWALVFGLHIAYLMTDGVFLITNPFVFGYGVSNAWLYITTALLDIIILILILWPNELILDIETTSYFFHYEITADSGDLYTLLGVDNKGTMKQPDAKKNVVIGILFLVIAVITRALNVALGTPVRLPVFLLGIILLIWGLKKREIMNIVFDSTTSRHIKSRYTGEILTWILEILIISMIGMTIGARLYFVPLSVNLVKDTITLVIISIVLIGEIMILWNLKQLPTRNILIIITLILIGFSLLGIIL